jgi:hypothetical protein
VDGVKDTVIMGKASLCAMRMGAASLGFGIFGFRVSAMDNRS